MIYRKRLYAIQMLITLCAFLFWIIPGNAAAQDSDALDADLEKHWTTQEIPAQDGLKSFSTEHRFELALSLGYLANDDYYNYVPITLDVQ